MRFVRFLLKRLVAIVLTTCAIIAVSYTMMYYAPGSFFNSQMIAQGMGALAVEKPALYRAEIQQFEDRYGMNKPLPIQILTYIKDAFTLNFGNSFSNPTVPIMSTLKTAFPISFFLAFCAIALAVLIGIPLGVVAALKRNTWLDYVATTASMFGQAVPAYVIAIIAVLIFGTLVPNVLPVNGWGSPAQAILPIFALALPQIGGVTRYMRGSLIETLRQDYIRTARAKGVPEWAVVLRHALRNSLIALVTVIGPNLAFTVVGTVWVEQIFSIPGLGQLLANAFVADDYPLAITSVFILSMLVMITNLLVDISYSLLDPRVTLEA